LTVIAQPATSTILICAAINRNETTRLTGLNTPKIIPGRRQHKIPSMRVDNDAVVARYQARANFRLQSFQTSAQKTAGHFRQNLGKRRWIILVVQ